MKRKMKREEEEGGGEEKVEGELVGRGGNQGRRVRKS